MEEEEGEKILNVKQRKKVCVHTCMCVCVRVFPEAPAEEGSSAELL